MAKLNLENVWQCIKKYDFYKKNEIEKEFLCTLCKKILISAHISPCTCRFCFDCISNYLNKEKKACPGNTDECKMELISLNENVVVDHAINSKISKLILKCPQELCEFKDELRNIENHIRICNYRSACCPYLNIGCNSSNMHAGKVIDHLQLEIVNHTKLLIDCIDNLNNEIGRLKIIVDKLGEENKMLKCEINEIKLDEERKQLKCDEQMREINILNEDMLALKNVDKHTRDDVNELKLDGKKKQTEIDILIKKLQEMESKFELENTSKIEREFYKLKLDGERREKKLERKCAEQTCKIDLLNVEIVKLRNVDKCMRENLDKLNLDGKRKQIEIDKLNKKLQEIELKLEIESISKIEIEFDKLKLDGERKEKDLERKCTEQACKIDLLNAEIFKLRNIDKCTREDVDKLKLDGERNKKELERKWAEQTGKIHLLYAEIVKMRNLDKCTREDVEKLKLGGERNKQSIGTLEKKCEQLNEEQIEQLNKKYQEIENKFITEKQEREIKTDLIRNEMRNKQIEMRRMSNRIDQTMKNVENKLLEIEIINQNKMNYGEFVWRINKINDKMKDAKNGINKTIHSDSFYTHKHGYKICLSVFPDGFGSGTHLSVYFCLIKGEFDDILKWPFKYDVTISLIDQQTRFDYVSWTMKYDDLLIEFYNKPINERRNLVNGFHKFIELQELSINANLTRNNQIFIKCSVNISS